MSPGSDDLVRRSVQGEVNALTTLLQRHGPEIRARLHVGAPWTSLLDADDILQVTYLEAFLRIGSLQGESTAAFVSWLERIAQNNLRDAIRELDRGKRPSPRQRITPDSDDSYRGLLETMQVDSETPSRRAAARESRQAIESALERLPQSYRKVVRDHDLGGHSITEVAAEMDRSTGAVHMLRARALERLRELLGSASRF